MLKEIILNLLFPVGRYFVTVSNGGKKQESSNGLVNEIFKIQQKSQIRKEKKIPLQIRTHGMMHMAFGLRTIELTKDPNMA